MKIFSDQMLNNFIESSEQQLRTEFPEKTENKNKKQMYALIQDGIEKAAKYGIKIENEVQQFLRCVILYGHDFDINPGSAWAREILLNKSISGTMKMRKLSTHLKQIIDK